mmetsp:Transcript_12231/g.22625  ORF Transcript_12231/g.22625 Transcript_12231/m.22625 type:complete len:297 (+) Transcript_12231:1599-2489(+)
MSSSATASAKLIGGTGTLGDGSCSDGADGAGSNSSSEESDTFCLTGGEYAMLRFGSQVRSLEGVGTLVRDSMLVSPTWAAAGECAPAFPCFTGSGVLGECAITLSNSSFSWSLSSITVSITDVVLKANTCGFGTRGKWASQGWSKACSTVARASTSGTKRQRRKSQQVILKSAGFCSTEGGQVVWISSSNHRSFTLVASCGFVAVRLVAPGPRYVFSNGFPTSIWYNVIPVDQTSTFSVCNSLASTSGDMYTKVPARLFGSSTNSVHQPKSAIFSIPSSLQSRLSGLISRCKMPVA